MRPPGLRYWPRVPALGAILTAIVTPFDRRRRRRRAGVRRASWRHLHANGSDGFVVCGTTGEASTLTDDEHLGVIALAVAERPEGATIVAGVGSNDTRHAVQLTAARLRARRRRRCCRSTPTTTGPTAAASSRTTARSRAPPTGRSSSTTSPSALVLTCPTTCSPSWRSSTTSRPSSRPTTTTSRRSTASPSTPATTRSSRACSTWAATAASSSPATSSARRCAGWSTSPTSAPRSTTACRPVFEALAVAPAAVSNKAALNLLGHDVGEPRLPYVEADEHETATIRAMLHASGLVGATA